MAVTANQVIKAQNAGRIQSGPVAASTHIYEGTMIFHASGYLSNTTGSNLFMGIAMEEADNSSGSAGDETCEFYTEGTFVLEGSGFSQGTVGSLIYASDNFTATTTSTSNALVGKCVEFISSTKIRVSLSRDIA